VSRFRVLGPVGIVRDGSVVAPTPPKVRRVLALLLVRANQLVTVDMMIEELWGDRPPRSAVTTAQTYVYQLRKDFDADWIHTLPSGYVLRSGADDLDANVFEDRIERGRALLGTGNASSAAAELRLGLALWTGSSLGDVVHGALLRAHAAHLDEQHQRALELRIQADAALGRHRDLVGELRSMVTAHPFNEWLHGQLMVALSRSGRRHEALQVYQDLRRVLQDQLGLEPEAALRRLHREVLAG
jgi:SARP family transcriptional regulator, regulator of embCAB operon